MGRIRLQIYGHSEALQRAQYETDFSTWFPLFHLDKPFPARPCFLGQGNLIHSEFGTTLADEGPQIGSGSNTHNAHLN